MDLIARVLFPAPREPSLSDADIAALLSPTIIQDSIYILRDGTELTLASGLQRTVNTWAARQFLQAHASTIIRPQRPPVSSDHRRTLRAIGGANHKRPVLSPKPVNRIRTLAILPPTYADAVPPADDSDTILFAAVAMSPALLWRSFSWSVRSPAPRAIGYVHTSLARGRAASTFIADPLYDGIERCEDIAILARSQEELTRVAGIIHGQLVARSVQAAQAR